MKTITRLTIILIYAGILTGCATTDQQLLEMKNKNANLSKSLTEKSKQIDQLSEENERLSSELNYFTRRGEVLEKEKAAQVTETVQLRRGIRDFTEEIQESLRAYYERTDIVDYLGSELIMRNSSDKRNMVLLVDLNNPVPQNGTIIGGRAWLTGPTRLSFCILRRQGDEETYTIISSTPLISTTKTGKCSWLFDLPLSAQKGDLVGIYVADTVTIPYDSVDTGNVLTFTGEANVDSTVTIVNREKRNQRTYSFGVMGYFDEPDTVTISVMPETEPSVDVEDSPKP